MVARRANRAEAARLSQLIRNDSREREEREQEEAILLGRRLFWDARGPCQLYPHTPYSGSSEPRISWSPDPNDPNQPAILVLRLERTVAGCRWLLDRWGELLARLEPGHVWLASDQFKAIRLLGKQPLDAVDDPDVLQILVAGSGLLNGDTSGKTFAPLASELNWITKEREDYLAKLVHRQLWMTGASDADSAHQVLRNIVNRETSRLKSVLARNERYALADTAEAPSRLAFDPSSEGEKLRRYVLSAGRLVNQTIRTYLSVVSCQLSVVGEDLSHLPGASCEVPVDRAELAVDGAELPIDHADPVGSCELPVADEGQIVGEASTLGEVAPNAPTEPTAESSLVPGPLSVVAEEGRIVGRGERSWRGCCERADRTHGGIVPGPWSFVRCRGGGPDCGRGERSWRGCSERADRTHGGIVLGPWSFVRCRGRGPGGIVLGPWSFVRCRGRGPDCGRGERSWRGCSKRTTEPTAVAGERKDNGKQTAQNDQPAPVPIPIAIAIPPTEPTPAACQEPSPRDERPEMIPELAAIYRRLLFQARGREMTAREQALCKRLLAQARAPAT